MSSALPVVHGCTHLRPLGGVQSMLRRHLRRDASVGLDPSGVIWFERGPFDDQSSGRPVTGLGLRWFHTGRILRRRFSNRDRPSQDPGAVWAFHDLWGVPTIADLDSSLRRIGILHSHWEGADDLLRASAGLLDGMLCVSAATVDLARANLPQLAPDRIAWLPYPVDPPPVQLPERPPPRAELVIGYCGRIQQVQKRVERLPRLARELRAAGIPHRWELLGDGPQRGQLERDMAAVGVPCRFHGILTGEAYWRVLADWDLIVFTSDFEGLPIAMLEAMSGGVVPVFPNVDCGGRDYTRRVAPELVYNAGDLRAAAQAVSWLRSQTGDTRRDLERRSVAAAAPHGGDAYGRTFASFVRDVASRPRVSATGPAARRRHSGEWFPFGLLGRLPVSHPLRRGYL